MRTAFIQSLVELARVRKNLFLVVGDLGYSVVEPFASEFADRFLNVGVAEQNMTGIAAGLAAEGYHVFAYSIANFPTLRCLEQIRNDVCYHRLSVTTVAVGAGLAYGNLGFSHHGIQDIAVMRCLPHIAIASPADPNETRQCLDWLVRNPGPSYLRLGKAGEPVLYRPVSDCQNLSPAVMVRAGRSTVAICATGTVLQVALAAADELEATGVFPAVFSLPILSPSVSEDYRAIWKRQNIVTIEEHVCAGGMGSMLRELAPDGVRIRSLCLDSAIVDSVGSQKYLWDKHGLTISALRGKTEALLR